jgi:hypothetical protein
VARRRKQKKPFIGDQVLACLTGFQCCGCVGILSLLGAVAAGYSIDLQGKSAALSARPGYSISSLEKMINLPAAGFAILAFLVAGFMIWLTVALWKGRKWSLWFMFLTHLPGALLSGFSRDYGSSAIGLAVAIYTFLRISGNAGPKL